MGFIAYHAAVAKNSDDLRMPNEILAKRCELSLPNERIETRYSEFINSINSSQITNKYVEAMKNVMENRRINVRIFTEDVGSCHEMFQDIFNIKCGGSEISTKRTDRSHEH